MPVSKNNKKASRTLHQTMLITHSNCHFTNRQTRKNVKFEEIVSADFRQMSTVTVKEYG